MNIIDRGVVNETPRNEVMEVFFVLNFIQICQLCTHVFKKIEEKLCLTSGINKPFKNYYCYFHVCEDVFVSVCC